MKASLLQIGILSILLTASLPSEGKNNNPGGGVVGRAVKGITINGGRGVNRGAELKVREVEREAGKAADASGHSVEHITTGDSANAALRITHKDAKFIVDTLATKVEITAEMKRSIKEVLIENSTVGQSAKRLAEKLQDPTTSEEVKTENLQTIVEYLTQVKNMEYGPRNEEHPPNENILMDLATNAMDMATWSENPRNNATSLLREIAQTSKTQHSVTNALDVALENRGYLTPGARAQRKREIRENCRK